MPDFERITRNAKLYGSKPEMRPSLMAEFRGEDKARWQIVRLTAGISAIMITVAWILGLV